MKEMKRLRGRTFDPGRRVTGISDRLKTHEGHGSGPKKHRKFGPARKL
jgi:hypothetical protein